MDDEGIIDSCSVCYESFSIDQRATSPRKLECGHIACTQCLEDCFEEDGTRRKPGEPKGAGVRCPECFEVSLCKSVDDVPKLGGLAEQPRSGGGQREVLAEAGLAGGVGKSQRENKLRGYMSDASEGSTRSSGTCGSNENDSSSDVGSGSAHERSPHRQSAGRGPRRGHRRRSQSAKNTKYAQASNVNSSASAGAMDSTSKLHAFLNNSCSDSHIPAFDLPPEV
ncbi:unnamed protein product, partial [Discosporangium mesarthrocarpum]